MKQLQVVQAVFRQTQPGWVVWEFNFGGKKIESDVRRFTSALEVYAKAAHLAFINKIPLVKDFALAISRHPKG